MPGKKEFITGLASVIVIFFTFFACGIFILNDPVLNQIMMFTSIAGEIASLHPLPFAQQKAIDDAEHALFSLLDPFSYRIDKSEFEQMREEYSGEYGGIGITVVPRDTILLVITVREGGPAYQAGMKGGDWIIAVDGQMVSHNDPASATDFIRGPSESSVEVTIYRPIIADTLQLSVIRSNIRLEHIPYYGLTESRYAYIRLADFEAGATDELADAVAELENRNPAGYIIDLKANPGGYLNEAIDAADLFLDKGILIVGTDGRSRWENERYLSSSRKLTERPIIILTDRGTASAAEIFTGALRGADRCVVVGDTTFGKGLVQGVFALFNNDAVRLTISRYYFADGRYLNPPDSALTFSGLAPDIVYREPGETAFREIMLGGFLMYDFIESNWELLSRYPDPFEYPDTVISLFRAFAEAKGVIYKSWLTQLLDIIVEDQRLSQASDTVLENLYGMQAASEQLDRDAFARHGAALKYYIRRQVVEKKSGVTAAYRDVIVPARQDIRLAETILTEPDSYRSLLTTPAHAQTDTTDTLR